MNLRLVVVLASLSAAGCAGIALPKEKLTDSPGGLMFNGYTKTNIDCFMCHNGDGRGTMRGPSLADHVVDSSDEQLSDVIKNGDGRMPAHKDRLSAEELAQILTWLRTNFPSPAKPESAAKPAAPEKAATP